jgi:hypothetical protein
MSPLPYRAGLRLVVGAVAVTLLGAAAGAPPTTLARLTDSANSTQSISTDTLDPPTSLADLAVDDQRQRLRARRLGDAAQRDQRYRQPERGNVLLRPSIIFPELAQRR